jgi:hypothetical protein
VRRLGSAHGPDTDTTEALLRVFQRVDELQILAQVDLDRTYTFYRGVE